MAPRASNQVSLWRRGAILLTFWEMFPRGLSSNEDAILAARSAGIIDQAILKMMEKDDE